MRKVVTAQEMVDLERNSFSRHGAQQAEEFMLAAGRGVAHRLLELLSRRGALGDEDHARPRVVLLCGKGNNAGDAYVAGTRLVKVGFEVKAISLEEREVCSDLCQVQERRFREAGGHVELYRTGLIRKEARFPSDLVVDALVGTGFRPPLSMAYRAAINELNQIPHRYVVSIDIPSGLCGTKGVVPTSEPVQLEQTGGRMEAVVRASETLFLGLPKIGFFWGRAPDYVGRLIGIDFGLEEGLNSAKEQARWVEKKDILASLPPIRRSRHKYQAGEVSVVAGSPGMVGAAVLSCRAALRSGAGMVRLFHPQILAQDLSAMPVEIVRVAYDGQQQEGRVLKAPFAELQQGFKRSRSVLLGPGLGLGQAAESLCATVISICKSDGLPLVIDADGLNLLSRKNWPLPKHTILTPHLGEMERLLGRKNSAAARKQSSYQVELPDNEFISECARYARSNSIVLVLKGAATFIFLPGESSPHISSFGDPGMATAGSGDVLAGMIASFLAQGVDVESSAKVGVALHGIAGEIAAQKMSRYSMIASDILSCLPNAFQFVLKDANPYNDVFDGEVVSSGEKFKKGVFCGC